MERRPATVVALIVLPLYLIAFLILRPDREPRTWEPGDIAAHLLAGEGFSLHLFAGHPQPSANQEPIYPLLLAGFLKWVPAPYLSLIVFQVLGWLGAALVVGRLARRWLGAPEVATALVVALWPPLVVYVLSYHPLWLRAAVLVLSLAAATSYRDAASFPRAAALGTALGLAAVVRAPFLALPVVILPWALRRSHLLPSAPRSTPLAHGALALLLAAAVVSPWVIRNRIMLGAWVPGTTTAGYTALMGNYVGADGVMDSRALQRMVEDVPSEIWSEPEPVRDRFFLERVRAFWLEHPGEAVRLYVSRLLYLWTWRPGVGGFLYPKTWTWAYLALWSLTLPLVLVGWRRALRHSEAEAPGLFLAVWVFLSVLYAFFAVNMRYRFESEALLVPYAVLAVSDGWNYLRVHRLGWVRASAPQP